MIISNKLVRGLLHVVSKHVRMDFNHTYVENNNDSVVVFLYYGTYYF